MVFRTRSRQTRLLVFSGLFGIASGACSNSPPELVTSALAPSAAPDETDPNALAEGRSKLFGVNLPARSTILTDSDLSGSAQVPAPFEKVSSYFRARLDAESVEVGPRATVFRRATIKGGDPSLKLNVSVRRTSQTAEVSFRKLIQVQAAQRAGSSESPNEEGEGTQPEPEPEPTGSAALPPRPRPSGGPPR